jgi:AcrR family transcriptional regulator
MRWGKGLGLMEKDQIYWKVLKAAMVLDYKRGHQKWTMSELARTSGVKRPLIYYYFGKSRMDILLAAVKVLGEDCFGLSEQRLTLWKSGRMNESVKRSRSLMQEHKDLAGFYFLHRAKENPVGDALRRLEKSYDQKIKRFFPTLSREQQEQIGAFFFGLVFAPALSDSALDECLKSVRIPKAGEALTASL